MTEIDLPKRIFGKIVWIDQATSGPEARYKIGIYFEELSADDELLLQTLVTARLESGSLASGG